MSVTEAIERVKVFMLQPGDRIVLETGGNLSQQESVEIHNAWLRAFPDDNPPVILTGGLTVADVLRKERA